MQSRLFAVRTERVVAVAARLVEVCTACERWRGQDRGRRLQASLSSVECGMMCVCMGGERTEEEKRRERTEAGKSPMTKGCWVCASVCHNVQSVNGCAVAAERRRCTAKDSSASGVCGEAARLSYEAELAK